jgi:hypothetical protein
MRTRHGAYHGENALKHERETCTESGAVKSPRQSSAAVLAALREYANPWLPPINAQRDRETLECRSNRLVTHCLEQLSVALRSSDGAPANWAKVADAAVSFDEYGWRWPFAT